MGTAATASAAPRWVRPRAQWPKAALVAALSVAAALVAPLAPPAAAADDLRVVAWGYNDDGQASVPGELSGATAVAGGWRHSVAVKSDGTVVAWGLNYDDQASVPAGLSGVTAVAAGSWHSVAAKADGTVVAWGSNAVDQTNVPPGLSGVTAVTAGERHSLALKSDGTVVAWGDNSYGQLSVPAGLSGVTAVSGGGYHNLALKSDGTVVAWGNNGYGQTNVPAGLSGVSAVAAGRYHSLAVKSDGTVVGWGLNDHEQATVPAGLSGVTAVTAGDHHSLALKSDGTVVAWGANDSGQTDVPAGLSGVTAVDAGAFHNLALTDQPAVTSVSPASGPVAGGNTVVLTGSGFIGATAVNFGPTAATSYTVDGDTQITAVAPAASAPGVVHVTVTTPGGTSATSAADQYGYLPELRVGDVKAPEGKGGSRTAYLPVTLSEPSPVEVTVAYATADGSATAPGDYGAKAGTLFIPPGKVSTAVAVPIKGDTTDEANETVKVTLSDADGATLADGVGVLTIVDDDPASGLGLAVGDVTISEGDIGNRTARLTVSLSAAAASTITVNYATADGTAAQPKDYVAKSGTLTFAPGQTSTTVDVVVKADAREEANEQFSVTLSTATGASITDKTGIVTIRTDD